MAVKIGLVNFYLSNIRNTPKYTLASLRLAQSMYQIDGVEIEVILCDMNNIEELYDYLEHNEFSAIAFSALSWTWNIIECICDRICNRDLLILVGGSEVLNHTIDELKGKVMLLYGEGEKFFYDLAIILSQCSRIDDVLQMDCIGLSQKKDGVYWCAAEWDYTMPLFDEKFLKDIKVDGLGEVLYYETTRGCLYSCGYCGYNFRKTCSGFLSPYIEDEISYMGKHEVRKIFVVDPIFGGTRANGLQLLEWFRVHAPKVAITAYMRPEFLNEEYIECLEKSNISCLRIGLQTTNEKVPQQIRSNDMMIIDKYLPCLCKSEITWRCEIIVGLPGDDLAGLMKTFGYIIDILHPTFLHAYRLMVVKDTSLHELVDSKEEKWVHISEENQFVIESYSYTSEELQYMLHYAELMVALYNSYAEIIFQTDIRTKIVNMALSFKELDGIVTTILRKCGNNYSTKNGLSMLQEMVGRNLSSELEDFV